MSKEDYNKIVEQIDKLSSNLTEEQKTTLGGALSTIKYSAQNLSDDVGTLLKETMTRKDKIREYESRESEWKQKIESFENDDTVSQLKAENEKLQGFREQVFNEKKKVFVDKYKKIKDHPNFEKVKSYIPEIKLTDDGADFTGIDDNQLLNGLSEIEKFESLNVFSNEIQKTKQTTPTTINFGDVDNLLELAKTNPEAYKKIREQKGYY